MDIFPDIQQVAPLPHEKVLRLAVTKMKCGYKDGWLYYQCEEQGLLEIYKKYKNEGLFDALTGNTSISYYPPRLSIELVPRTCWFDNVRSRVPPKEWTRLKKHTSQKANRCCEICGGRGPKWPVECHEIWHYDDMNLIQKLVGLVSLCPACHEVKHIGFTQLKGKELEATAHLAIVNGWSYSSAEDYIELSFDIWSKRSQKEWSLDITWLQTLGVSLIGAVDTDENVNDSQFELKLDDDNITQIQPDSEVLIVEDSFISEAVVGGCEDGDDHNSQQGNQQETATNETAENKPTLLSKVCGFIKIKYLAKQSR